MRSSYDSGEDAIGRQTQFYASGFRRRKIFLGRTIFGLNTSWRAARAGFGDRPDRPIKRHDQRLA